MCVHYNANILYSYALYLRILILKLYVRLRRERVVDMPRGHLHLYPQPFEIYFHLSDSIVIEVVLRILYSHVCVSYIFTYSIA